MRCVFGWWDGEWPFDVSNGRIDERGWKREKREKLKRGRRWKGDWRKSKLGGAAAPGFLLLLDQGGKIGGAQSFEVGWV